MVTSSTADVGPHSRASPPKLPNFNVDGRKDAHPQLGKWQPMPDRTNIEMGGKGVSTPTYKPYSSSEGELTTSKPSNALSLVRLSIANVVTLLHGSTFDC